MIVYLGENTDRKIQVAVRCKKCKKFYNFEIEMLEWNELIKYLDKRSELKIQEILPNVIDDIREIFVSGICGKCFNEICEILEGNNE